MVHSPVPPHLQEAHRDLVYRSGELPGADELAREDVSRHLRDRATELTDDELDAFAGGLVHGRATRRPGRTSFLKNPWVLGAIVATAIAVPLAVSDEDDGA